MTLLRTSLLLLPALVLACGGDAFVQGDSAGGTAGASAGGAGGNAGSAAGSGGDAGGAAGFAGGSEGGAAGNGQAGDGGSGQAGDAGAGGDAGTGGSDAGSGGEAGAGGDAGSGGSDAGAGGSDAGAGGSDAGSGGNAGVGGSAGDGGSGQSGAGNGGAGGGPTGNTVYVSSTTGDDNASGFAHDQPKKTLAAAVALATSTAGVTEIKLCRGEYKITSTIELPAGLSMTGGYECATFDNPTVYTPQDYCNGNVDASLMTTIYGTASPLLRLLPGNNKSTLRGLDLLTQRVGVEMQNTNALLEQSRIVVDPAATKTGPSAALMIYGGSPQIKASCLKGGPGLTLEDQGATTSPASVGVGILDGSTAELTSSVIDGGFGDGKDKGLGSIGVMARNASPGIKNNMIIGGSGISSKRTASIGVFVHSTPGSSAPSAPDIKNNPLIHGGDGTHTNGGRGSIGIALFCDDDGGDCAGVDVSGSKAVSGNTIHGGKGKNTGTPQFEVQSGVSFYGGASFQNMSAIDLIDNRITGGTTNGGTPPSKNGPIGVNLVYARGRAERNSILGGQFNADAATGINVSHAVGLRIVNNMIYSGFITPSQTSRLQGIFFANASSLTIAHNTILLGNGAQIARGITMGQDQGNSTATSTSEVRIENNLLLGGEDPHYGIEFTSCPAGRIASLQGNGFANLKERSFFLNFSGNTACGGGSSAGNEKILSAGGYQQVLAQYCESVDGCGSLAAQLKGNIEILTICAQNLACETLLACADYNTCAGALFNLSSVTNEALTNALLSDSNKGWKLRSGLNCNIHRSPVSPPDIPTDFYLTARPKDQYSRGADQQNNCFGGN